jgi:hypothetical protein
MLTRLFLFSQWLNSLSMRWCVGNCSDYHPAIGAKIVCDWYFANIRFWYRGDDGRLTLHTETVDAVYADSFEFAKVLASQRNPVKPWEMLCVERVCTRRDKEAAKRLSAERLLENMRFIQEMEEMLR